MATCQTEWSFKSVYSRSLIWDGQRWLDEQDLLKMPNDKHLNRLKRSDPFKGPPIVFTKQF